MFGHALKERPTGGPPLSARSSANGPTPSARSSANGALQSAQPSVDGSRAASTQRSVETPGLSFAATLRPEQASWPADATLPFSTDGLLVETQPAELT